MLFRSMGAGPKMPYPKWVWSPAGGWYCNPPNWKRNTAIVLAGWGVLAYFTFKISAANERRLSPPYHHIPSQQWCAWAKHDDPSLPR